MNADKYHCPKCGYVSTVKYTTQTPRDITRYRHCRMCNVNFATVETLKDTDRVRSWLGAELSAKLFKPKPFKYRTIKQQNRVTKSTS